MQLIVKKIINIVATRCQIFRLKCTKIYCQPQTPLRELTALPQTPSWNKREGCREGEDWRRMREGREGKKGKKTPHVCQQMFL